MKLKYEDKDNFVKLRRLRPGECFRFLYGPDVYMVTDYQGEYHLYINIGTGETTFLSDIRDKEVISLQVEAIVKRHTDSKEESIR